MTIIVSSNFICIIHKKRFIIIKKKSDLSSKLASEAMMGFDIGYGYKKVKAEMKVGHKLFY